MRPPGAYNHYSLPSKGIIMVDRATIGVDMGVKRLHNATAGGLYLLQFAQLFPDFRIIKSRDWLEAATDELYDERLYEAELEEELLQLLTDW
jgi:hypothetical protein